MTAPLHMSGLTALFNIKQRNRWRLSFFFLFLVQTSLWCPQDVVKCDWARNFYQSDGVEKHLQNHSFASVPPLNC
ncbi:hypothetical protein AERO9A_250087 [Aeromonas salmonicida]|nr:hypothetical protein AERO9A_250087 [Aeromonas salmonicida]